MVEEKEQVGRSRSRYDAEVGALIPWITDAWKIHLEQAAPSNKLEV